MTKNKLGLNTIVKNPNLWGKKTTCDNSQLVKNHILFENTSCDMPHIYYKTQIMTQHKLWQFTKCDKTQSKTKHTLEQNYNCERFFSFWKSWKKWDITQSGIKNKMWPKSKLLQNSNCNKTNIVTKLKLWQVCIKNKSTILWDRLRAAFFDLAMFVLLSLEYNYYSLSVLPKLYS